MEVSSTIAKTFKRFTIPRSNSSIGSFTTSNGTATTKEVNSEASTPSSPSSRKHPPLSYVQHLRSVQIHHSQDNLTTPNFQQENSSSSDRTVTGDLSSYMIRSASIDLNSSTNEYKTKKTKMSLTSKRFLNEQSEDLDQAKNSSVDNNNNTNHGSTEKVHEKPRASFKNLLAKKFQPLTVSSSVNITSKQKKPGHSFRHFPNFLRRSHSTSTDLSTILRANNPRNPVSTDLVYEHVQAEFDNELNMTHRNNLNGNHVCNTNNTALVTISEEDNAVAAKETNKIKYVYDKVNSASLNDPDNGISTQQNLLKSAPSLSVSSSSLSGASSTSNKYQNAPNQSHQPDEPLQPSKSSQSVTSNNEKSRAFATNGSNDTKNYLSNSISVHGDVNYLMNHHHNSSASNTTSNHSHKNNKEKVTIHQTMSFKHESDTANANQPTNKVKMRDHSSKKKKGLRELKARISLPPELKNGLSQRPNSSNPNPSNESSNIRQKLAQRSSYYQTTSASFQGLHDALNQSNVSSAGGLSPQFTTGSGGSASRNEHRLSMLDLGFGKIESYVKLEKLGEGTYATVYKGTSRLLSGYVALKEIRLEQEEGAPCTALREVSLLKGLKHNNIVSLYDIIFNQTTLTLVFEYVERDLKQYMDDCANFLNMKNVRLFLFQLLRGLEFCHAKKILHRDLKPQNLLINERGELKLADFGLARIKSFPTKTYSHEVVTLWYRPPDVLLGSTEYSTPIDIWAVGCIFYEMACGRPLFAGTKVDEELYLIFKYLGTPTEQTLPGVTSNADFQALRLPFHYSEPLTRLAPRLDQVGIDLLDKFLRYNPNSRISARDAMAHKFFSCYPLEVHTLGPLQSLLDVNGITLTKDHGSKLISSSLMKTAISKRSSVHL